MSKKYIHISFLLLICKYHNSLVTQVMHNIFVRNTAVHNYSTRQHNILHVPLARTDMAARNIRVTGVKLYNHFIGVLDWEMTYLCFKANLKRFILQNDTTATLYITVIYCPDLDITVAISATWRFFRGQSCYLSHIRISSLINSMYFNCIFVTCCTVLHWW